MILDSFLILIPFIFRKPVALTSMRGHTKSAHKMSIGGETFPLKFNLFHYIILNNGILKSNSTIFPRSKGFITQYTP